MIICPFCNRKNIEGADICEQCQQSLDDTYLPAPASEVEKSLLTDRVNVLHPKTPITVKSSQTVAEVLQFLVDRAIGCVVVVDGSEAVGIFSERDALMRLNTDAVALGDRPISEFMTPHPQTLEADAKIAFAAQRMDLGGYRHVPIVNRQGNLTGIISVRDILRYLTEKMSAAVSADS